ncbi:fatty acid hydroxylase superfamily-domain-containing protein [Aspergillus caelatus]|uniref:Fatty acid hydroxylase superfamily-domain-containing protein n=2 Tax=Aspergillus subgen. Circumdati TaxID=2720871 RepID=A0A5N7ABS9_9EURO|nr:fatty acid hydroxylase superfamily-domain-containing protein [Aspergillus caelatus]KAE8367282.1 fatty acid hydroxylase superfamily-domain-containing protein [Aspergillus caelatus]KAE8419186.1 fatty acid hydroxylase superfamily-domain-containing protein [Aspergillus pseudocaelatus]
MAVNASVVYDLPPLPAYTLTPRPPLLSPIPDNVVALILPIIAYWALSMVYHYIDVYDLFPQYRLHTPAEVLKRNHVSRWEVVRDVILQQIIQTMAGMAVSHFDPVECIGKEEYDVAVWAQRIRLLQRTLPRFLAVFGIDSMGLAKSLSKNGYTILGAVLAGGRYPGLTQTLVLENGVEAIAPAFAGWELSMASFIYWYFIPTMQFVWGVCVVDTWQYFLHRAMHLNRWLYVTFHSRHHRLYVPYAFGALYNHPVEGFLLDTAGTGVAFLTARMTNRQAMWFFTCSTIKTVDDHCGYAFPWDPLQHFTSNNAAYHDIHHQSWGIKTNFSQPFFTIWDRLLETQWKGDVKLRYERGREAAQRKLDDDNALDIGAKGEGVTSSATVSSGEPADTTARSRLRKRTATFDGLKGSKHGVASSVL